MLFALVAALVFAFGTDIYDVVLTEKGIKAGVAVEGNLFLLNTNKPTAVQLYLRDAVYIAGAAAPSCAALILGSDPFFWAGIVAPVLLGIKHILGARRWQFLLNGGKIDPTVSKSAWDKFIEG